MDEKCYEIAKDYIFGDWRISNKTKEIRNETMDKIIKIKERYIAEAK
jgi:hypothetical protein